MLWIYTTSLHLAPTNNNFPIYCCIWMILQQYAAIITYNAPSVHFIYTAELCLYSYIVVSYIYFSLLLLFSCSSCSKCRPSLREKLLGTERCSAPKSGVYGPIAMNSCTLVKYDIRIPVVRLFRHQPNVATISKKQVKEYIQHTQV